MYLVYGLIPLVGGIIGWGTNVLAIKLLFRPFRAVKLGPFTVQGLIPRRRAEIVQAVADTVASELVDIGELFRQVTAPQVQSELSASVMRVVQERGRERLPGFLPEAIRTMILEYLRKVVGEELTNNLPVILDEITGSLRGKFDIRAMVVERLEAMDLEELEALILRLARRELKAIEYLGGILGFLIGLVQLAFVLLV